MTFTPIRDPDLAAVMARLQEAAAAIEAAMREVAKADRERKE